VDEFQDTDRVQAEIVRLLAAGTPAPLVFVVGDEKQSIYRFRGADVSVFQDMRAELGCERPLGTNFRSVPAVLDFVNALAAAILQVPPGGSASHWTRFDEGQRLLPHRSASGPEPAVRLVTFVHEHDQRELRAAEARELEARVLAGVVERLHAEDGIRYGDIAVLLRAFTEVKTYENALRRRELPYYVVKGRGFFQCQEVSDVVSLLAAILDPEGGVCGDRLRGGLPDPVPGHAQGGQRAQADRAGARLGAQALLHPARLRAHRPPHGGERAARAGGGAGGRAGRRGAPDDHPPGEG